LESSAVSAVLIIFIVLVIFVGLKSGLILGLFIPIVFGSVFFVFYLLGLSLNTISLFALVLALGLFVDDGTIVVEAIDLYRKRGNGPLKSVILAINDIALADISGTVTTLLVFFPLLFISGLLGEFIRILPITVIISLTLSLFIGLFVLPLFTILLSSRNQDSNNKLFKLFKNLDKLNILEKISNFVLKVGEILGNFTKTYLSNKYLLLVMVIFTFFVIGLGFSFASRLGFSFFPPAKDSDSLSLNLTFAENLNLDRKRELFLEFEQKLKETIENYGELFSIQRNIGNTYQAQLFLTPLQQRDITSVQIAEKINQISDKFKDELSIRSSSISAGPPSQQLPFATQIYLKNFDDDTNAIDIINEFISSQAFENGNKVKETQIQYISDIARLNGKRFIQIRAGFENNSDSSALRLLKERITKEFDNAKLTELGINSIEFDFGQESSNEESFNSLIVLSLLSLVLMYGVLVFQFNSFTQPLLILLAIPFALPGVLFGLYITNNPISFLMIIGLTGLIGIVVNNTIMLVDFANQNILKGYGTKVSISKAISVRFRPILLTSLTTILGLVPLSLSEPFWEPLAVTIIFGLTSSVILVLFTFPIFYAIVQKLRHKFNFFKLDNILADSDI
jgi:multidrug efflux pump subunit AcrB